MNTINEFEGKILITGASGFVGKNIARTLFENNSQVVIHKNVREISEDLQNKSIKIIHGNLENSTFWNEVLTEVDTIIHCAAITPNQQVQKKININYDQNVDIVKTIAHSLVSKKFGLKKFIYISTSNFYKNGLGISSEQAAFAPVRDVDYFRSKFESEKILLGLEERKKIELTILRISTPFGPGETMNKVIPTFLSNSASGRNINILDNGKAKYNFISVFDVASVVYKCTLFRYPGIYNLGGHKSTSIIELAKEVMKLFPLSNSKIEFVSKEGFFDYGFSEIDITKLKNFLNFNPKSLRFGLYDYANFLRLDPNL